MIEDTHNKTDGSLLKVSVELDVSESYLSIKCSRDTREMASTRLQLVVVGCGLVSKSRSARDLTGRNQFQAHSRRLPSPQLNPSSLSTVLHVLNFETFIMFWSSPGEYL